MPERAQPRIDRLPAEPAAAIAAEDPGGPLVPDPQLHTHCVLANMTRNASGEWHSVEPTMIRRTARS